MNDKKDILWRVYLVYAGIIIFAIVIVVKICFIQFVHGAYWEKEAKELTLARRDIKALRGNIYADDGSLLATTVPIYEIRVDLNADAITKEIFSKDIDSLSYDLSNFFKDKSPAQYKRELVQARRSGNRYFLIHRNVSYTDMQVIKEFPLFRLGRYGGGFIAIRSNKRTHPFGTLALRTIGYPRKNSESIGLEGAYSEALSGTNGKRLMKKIAGGIWIPAGDHEIEPRDGYDVYSTIDINIQDVAEHALRTKLIQNKADHGCVIVMEVKTGEIKAIANLKMAPDSTYYEGYNYAIGASTEPGSIFKLASLMVTMDDGKANLNTKVNITGGVTSYYGLKMKDADHVKNNIITLERAFEISSNVGVSKIVYNAYHNDPQRFINRLYALGLNKKLGLQIAGEGQPLIKHPGDPTWSGTTLPWTAIGYEVRVTPLQILTLYNAVANNGKEVKPRFVDKIMFHGKLIKKFPTIVMNPAIASQHTIKECQQMLEGVVQDGTARRLKNSFYQIAGKTGTAQIANAKYGYHYDSKVSYQASFAGYFPVKNPKYSIIVVINAPSNKAYYAAQVACPIFKAISDKLYAKSLKMMPPVNAMPDSTKNNIPISKDGDAADLKTVLAYLNTKVNPDDKNSAWVNTHTQDDDVKTTSMRMVPGTMPDVEGMGIQDAVYLLGNRGINVSFTGSGPVQSQSIAPGTATYKGETVQLKLGKWNY